MTTDTTELAQSHELRNKVNHRLYGALEFQGTSGEHATISLSIDECKSVISVLDERLALVEALEKAQRTNAAQDDHINQQQDRIEQLERGNRYAAKRISSWRRLAKQSIAEQEKCVNELDAARQRIVELDRKNSELDSLTQRWAVERAENAERINQLESRTVKLPPKIERNDTDGWFTHKDGRVGGGAAEWYNKALDDVGAELTAAGIKWEAE
ncbi:hypothetical protein MRO88_024175 [Klebsiella oxytoca]|uniref:hypothetical protein n=1 Tax=Klebsiella oxytoca TaxID=571 RepID=UPI001FBB0379|nr:hypothetical protein [Klebsiella oxytoca]MCJ2272645.1 hypothetical protein [Klebsiella oxytoca]